MSESYAREILRRNVAQICQTIGWNGINSTPLDILVHVLEKYIRSLGTQTSRYAEQFNRTEPNLQDLGLVFRDLHVQLPELAEFTRSVPLVPPPVNVEKFPKPKESNLNFLKPGSHEVVTRPMHVHEHLPPMYPEKERDTPAVADTIEIRQNGIDNTVDNNSSTSCTSPEISVTDSPEKPKEIFKRPNDPVSFPSNKKPRLRLEEEERTREISSVMMTMSGFLSPAREGKLPEPRPPTIVSEKHYDRHKVNSHHSNIAKPPTLDKVDKKSKKSKLLNGKIMKSKRKDKSHKDVNKSKDSKIDRYPPGHPMRKLPGHPSTGFPVPLNQVIPSPKLPTSSPKNIMPPPSLPVPEPMRPAIKLEPVEHPSPVSVRNATPVEDAIPVPRRIPISKSPLMPNSLPVNNHPSSSNTLIPETAIKKEIMDEEVKLASQPDRSKVNIFKRISNKSIIDKIVSEGVLGRPQSESMISTQNSALNTNENRTYDNVKVKSEETVVNNNDCEAIDLSKEIDLTANEVISLDEDSLEFSSNLQPLPVEPPRALSIKKSLQVPFPKDVSPSISPKVKKDKKHKEKKDKVAEKTAKQEAKILKKQQQLAYEMAMAEKQGLKLNSPKTPKSSRPKSEKIPQMPPGFPFFPSMPGRGLMSNPGLIPNPALLTGGDFLNFANNPALRGLGPPNLLSNPFALSAGGPGLIPGPSFLTGGLPNPLLSNFPHSSRSSSSKSIPSLLRRPGLEVIPIDNDDDRRTHKTPLMSNETERHDKHNKTIPSILQKHHRHKSHKEHKSNMLKMPPVHPDITIELNPPKPEPPRQQLPPVEIPAPVARSPTPEPVNSVPLPIKEEPPSMPNNDISQDKEVDKSEKKKDKSHKKEKKDKDGLKIKKKKDKKDKNKDKAEKKKEKDDKIEFKEIKDKIKKEKKDKKKDKINDGLVPKLTLKLNSSNSNSPMPPSSPETFKLNIKPVVKQEDDSPALEEPLTSREHSRSPELAQISALVTRPPKQKLPKQNHTLEVEGSPPPSSSSPTRKNRPPSSHSKYKRILLKPMSKKGHIEDFDDDIASVSEEPTAPLNKTGPLPTPYYVDEQGTKVWVCPACGQPDNGSPMIGCDGCDGWYHWVCVGITEEPGATEDWFCKSCLAKRDAMALAGVTSGKKRGRKPKMEKVRECQ